MTEEENVADVRVRVEASDGVVRLVLANGAGHNAVDFEFGAQFRAALAGPAQGARVVEIVAEGPNFCVGGDVRGFAADPDSSLSALADDFHACQRILLDLAVPVVIGVQGWAAGIGLSLVLTGDIVVLGEGARLRPAYTAIGLTPDGGMTATLPAAVGRARALDMFLTNRPMGAAEALTAGLASRVVPDESLHAEVASIGAAIAAGPPQALAATKKLVRAAGGVLTDTHFEAEAKSIGDRGLSAEGREGVASFVGKRAPVWHVASPGEH
ncbi:enoyl-CoA hydratase/isomerase family protein [Actinomycetospora chiangmaiensis]|uniref:enoyl-CoA hydratase/isomerase family protein n=1 Tax=Actinomycetospora chiangmaiensis TaxID=402650 RepID=UPI0003725B33|nr:enoyl-CoA hydratase-related protein [Actinomycetospora chiangmaiensis]